MIKNFFKRKFLLAFLMFFIAQYFKYKGCIGDWAWIVMSSASVIGYSAFNVILKVMMTKLEKE